MHIVNIRTSGILLALTTLAGCYAQIEDTDVSYVQSNVCGTPSTCLANNASLTLDSDFVPPITVNLGDSGLLTSSQSQQGPINFNGNLTLNQAVLTMTTAGNFNGVRSIDLRAALGDDDTCAALSANCKSIATYDSARDGTANQMLVVKGAGVKLLDLASGRHQLTIVARATGNAPSVPTWNGDLELNMSIKTRGSFP